MNDMTPLNHLYEVLCIFWGWTAALGFPLKGKQILWDFDAHPEDDQHR